MHKDHIIYQPWGGLGDNLCHTVFPPLCKKYGLKCSLSNQNAYRNSGIYDFLWAHNPDISGRVDFNDISWAHRMNLHQGDGLNVVEATQKHFGFPVEYHYPIIGYTPKKIDGLQNTTLLDTSSISTKDQYLGHSEKVHRAILSFSLDENTLRPKVNQVNCQPYIDLHKNFPEIEINSLEHYSDVIYSCKRMITFHSGQAVLASAIKNKTGCDVEISVISMDIYMPDRGSGYHFKNTNYYDLLKF